MSANRIEVCPESELGPGEKKIVEANGVSIGVFNVDGEYHALLNNCPHQNGPVCEGDVKRDVAAKVPPRSQVVEEFHTDEHTVICPLHAWSFSIRTGEHTGDPTITIPTYETAVSNGTVYIEF